MQTLGNVDEELAFEMVELVLDAAGQEARRRQMLLLAAAVEEFHLDLGRALHFTVDARHRETALRIRRRALTERDDGIDELDEPVVVLAVDDDDADGTADLRRCEADAIALTGAQTSLRTGAPAFLISDIAIEKILLLYTYTIARTRQAA